MAQLLQGVPKVAPSTGSSKGTCGPQYGLRVWLPEPASRSAVTKGILTRSFLFGAGKQSREGYAESF